MCVTNAPPPLEQEGTSMTDKEAMKLALEALEDTHYRIISAGLLDQDLLNRNFTVATDLRERLAQPEQEPICPECKAEVLYECVACSSNNYPPKRTEQEQKDEDWDEIFGNSLTIGAAIKNTEAKLRSKNI